MGLFEHGVNYGIRYTQELQYILKKIMINIDPPSNLRDPILRQTHVSKSQRPLAAKPDALTEATG
jgi:hypothetical protein